MAAPPIDLAAVTVGPRLHTLRMTIDPNDQAAQYAAAARRYLPEPSSAGADRPLVPDGAVASALASLAVYHQLRALRDDVGPYGPLVRAVRGNTETADHVAGAVGYVGRELGEVRTAVEKLEWSTHGVMRQLIDSPVRRWAEAIESRWQGFKLRRMPPPPPRPLAVRRRTDGYPSVQPISEVDRYTGEKFEQYVAQLLRRAGWAEVEVVGANARTPVGQGDHGVDIIATDGETKLAVQCRRHAAKNTVGARDIRDFLGGAKGYYKATATLFVTTASNMSPSAQQLADTADVIIVGRSALTDWVEQGAVPTAVAKLRKSNEDSGDDAQEAAAVEPPHPPRSPMIYAMILLVLSTGMIIGAQVLQAAQEPQWKPLAVASLVLGFVVPFMLWLRYQWCRYWWRRGINDLWTGWAVSRWDGKARRVTEPWPANPIVGRPIAD
jgi:hypothetical protein